MPLVVKGMRQLQAALAQADRDVRFGVTQTMRNVAEPVRQDAETLAATRIRNIGTDWSRMRVGVTRRMVYVAPRRRGVKPGHPASRPNLARLLRTRAMDVAEQRNQAEVRRRFERMLDHMADRFN